MTNHKDAYHLGALPITIENAISHNFYAAHWSSILRKCGTSQIKSDPRGFLAALPITQKSNLQIDLVPKLSAGDVIASTIHTTGSTGPVTYRYRSRSELKAIDSFFTAAKREIPLEKRPHALMFYGPYHGVDFGSGGMWGSRVAPNYFSGAIWDDIFIRQSVDLLRKEFNLPGMAARVGTVTGAVRLLRIFTQCLIDQGIEASDFAVRGVSTFAGFSSTEVRKFLHNYWRVHPIEVFSISEIMGGARKCPECAALSFDPQIYPEVVTLDDERPVDKGIGRLLLTELHPFGSTQPLVRYYNGDLVSRRHVLCQSCGDGVKTVHIGRDNESIVHKPGGGNVLVFGSSDMREVAYCQFVERTVEFPHLKLLRDRTTHLGAPYFSVTKSVDTNRNRVRIEVRFRPRSSLSCGVNRAAAAVHERVLETSADLREAIAAGFVDLSVVPDPEHNRILWK